MEILTQILDTLISAGGYAIWFALAYLVYLAIIALATIGTIVFLGSKALDIIGNWLSGIAEKPKVVRVMNLHVLTSDEPKVDELMSYIQSKSSSKYGFISGEDLNKARQILRDNWEN